VAAHPHRPAITHCAHSPRLRRHFYGKKFNTVVILPQANAISISQQWKTSLDETLLARPKTLDNALSTIRNKFGASATAAVHCECAFIGYFQSLPQLPAEAAPLDYLGVSKPSFEAHTRT